VQNGEQLSEYVMNDQTRSELQTLKANQARLESELAALRVRLGEFEVRLGASDIGFQPASESTLGGAAQTAPAWVSAAAEDVSMGLPPLISSVQAVAPALAIPTPLPGLETAPEAPKVAVQPAGVDPSAPAVSRADALAAITQTLGVPPSPPPVPPIPPVGSEAGAGPESSFEMRLGTYWLVRVGIVMVLTALVFFGNLAYQNFISKLGPSGKVGLLYTASLVLLGAGAFWMRRTSRDTVKNYAQVLFAGGLAGVYFTTYAAHHFKNLHVITDPVLDGFLLLGWAGFMVWIADRKKSEVLALFAVGLAYYTSIITRVGYFTLYSNLLLTAVGVFFLVRNRWATLSFVSLAATYGSYSFWRFFHDGQWAWASPGSGLWHGAWILAGYWVLFTAGVFLSRCDRFAGPTRAGFLTFNNGAFLASFLLTMFLVREGGLWRVLVVFGSVLLVLSVAARKFLAEDALARNSYLTQGLVLVTLGLIAKFSGMKLALMLGGESVILLFLAQQRQDKILRAGAYIAAALAVGWGMDGFARFDNPSMYLGIGLGVLMLANCVLTDRELVSQQASVMRPPVAYFAGLALLCWGLATWHNTAMDLFPVLLALEALIFTMSIYLLRIREIALLGQVFLATAVGLWIGERLEDGPVRPWWNSVILIAVTLGLSHWWQRQKAIQAGRGSGVTLQSVYSLGLVALAYWSFRPHYGPEGVLVLASLVAVGLTVYAAATRLWPLAGFAQLLLLPAGLYFVVVMASKNAEWYRMLVPMGSLVILATGARRWLMGRPGSGGSARELIMQLGKAYQWVAVAMSLWWIQVYIPVEYRVLVAGAAGAAAFAFAGWRVATEPLLICGAYLAFALGLFLVPQTGVDSVTLQNLVVLFAILGLQRVARLLPEKYPIDARVHTGLILAGGLSLWLFVSRWVLEGQSGFYLTASWSLLALVIFTSGFLFREKIYRWLGLGILACALGRVVVFDVWKLETLYRILSFLALGIVLLVLGFIYSRYQEKIRQWL